MVTKVLLCSLCIILGDNIPVPELPSLEESGNDDKTGEEDVINKVDGEREDNVAQSNIDNSNGGSVGDSGESATQGSTGNGGGDKKKVEKKDPLKEDKIDINLVSKVRSTP